MLILLPISAVYSFEQHGLLSAFGTSIFVISLFLMFLSSTVYHAMSYDSPQKYVLRIIDHSMIYIAIAGSYTPVVPHLDEQLDGLQHYLDPMGNHHLWHSLQNLCQKVNEKFSLALYLIMGWLVIFIIPKLLVKLPRSSGDSCSWAVCATRWELAFMPRKTLFPYDLAPLHPCRFCPSVFSHRLLYVICSPLFRVVFVIISVQ